MERKTYKFNPKPEFEARMNEVLKLSGSDDKDIEEYWKIVHKEPLDWIRCNTLKITPEELKERLEKDNKWKIKQPFKDYPEIMLIEEESNLKPGELGRSKEHLLGYYYVQEASSMMPILALKPAQEDSFLDLCASPGSKTTQAAAMMQNKGSIIANDNSLGRMMILSSNLEKCGVSNAIIMKKDGAQLCKHLKQGDINFDKLLVDAPCSGEGTLRSSPKTYLMWNLKMIEKFSRRQKLLASKALGVLKTGGEIIYSTCTHAPEENEGVIQSLLDNHDIELLDIKKELPLKTREGLTEWQGRKFSDEMKKARRIYPQDNNTEGFFLCKIRKLSDKIKNQEEKNENHIQL